MSGTDMWLWVLVALLAMVNCVLGCFLGHCLSRCRRLKERARNQDAEQLRVANQRLRTVALRYQQSNQDLESFASAASHDLQTPLRKIKNFAIHLNDEFGDRLQDEDAQLYLHYIVSGAEKMQELVDGLLRFSRVGKQVKYASTALEDVVTDVESILAEDVKEKRAKVRRGLLPVVKADKMLLTRVFQNLIGNAIKFRHPDRDPEIYIWAENGPGAWTIHVEDNGVGIDMREAERVFKLFQRIGRKSGTGLGLALCKRVVERHGGKIWLTSRPGIGSTFHFTLPKEPDT